MLFTVLVNLMFTVKTWSFINVHGEISWFQSQYFKQHDRLKVCLSCVSKFKFLLTQQISFYDFLFFLSSVRAWVYCSFQFDGEIGWNSLYTNICCVSWWAKWPELEIFITVNQVGISQCTFNVALDTFAYTWLEECGNMQILG